MRATLLALIAAALAGGGVYLCLTPVARRERAPSRRRTKDQVSTWIRQAGLHGVSPAEFLASSTTTALVGGLGAYLLFAAAFPAVVTALIVGAAPVGLYKRRRDERMEKANDSWPALLEEIRLRTGALGRSIPQALFEAGRNGPPDWRPAFAAAEREWQLTIDFPRTLRLLRVTLANPTADVVCETLEVANELGGPGLDRRLADLIADRQRDAEQRREVDARQSGVRFARRFVVLVPLGMALAGLSIGAGRQSYATPAGQLAVTVAVLSVLLCWLWAGRLMKMPDQSRVFR